VLASIGHGLRDAPLIWALRLFRTPAVIHLHGGYVDGFFGASFFRRFCSGPPCGDAGPCL